MSSKTESSTCLGSTRMNFTSSGGIFRPDLQAVRRTLDITASAAGLVLALYILQANAIVVLAPGIEGRANAAQLAQIVKGIDAAFKIAVVVWIFAAGWDVIQALWRRRGA